ncbi:MAG: hypothetical protein WAN89_03315 [Lawsonella sp.]|nr:hypothetical protein [Mycobacteriales bacterium]
MKSEGRSKKFLVTDDDSNKPLRRALFFGVLTVLGVAVVGTIIAGIVVGKPGVWGALMGAATAGVFTMITVIVGLATKNLSPNALFGVVMGSWIIKVFLLIGVLLVLKGLDFYDRPSFGIVLVVSLVAILIAETLGVKNTKVPYVQTRS